MTYIELLQTNEWLNKRKKILERDKYSCMDCGIKDVTKEPCEYTRNGIWTQELWFDRYTAFHICDDGKTVDGFEIQLDTPIEVPTFNVHHLKYIVGRKPWEYEDNVLITLCISCHEKRHKNKEIPIYIYREDGSLISIADLCLKCGGSGYISKYKYYMKGICFDCWGEGVIINE